MLDKTLTIIMLVVGIIIFTVVTSSLSGVSGVTCPTQGQSENALQAMLRNSCNFVGSFGGVIIIIASILGIVMYLYYFRGNM